LRRQIDAGVLPAARALGDVHRSAGRVGNRQLFLGLCRMWREGVRAGTDQTRPD